MELFHKIYSCYYNVVRHILDEAGHSPITRQDMEDICRAYGFQESALSIIPKLTDSTWALLEEQDKHMQELNPKKDTASNPMIMFLVLNTSGLTLIPISIMVPCVKIQL